MLRLLIAVSIVASGLVAISPDRADSALSTSECPAPRETAVTHPYPVSGYWIYQDRDPCRIRSKLEAIHKLGGDTILTFGPRLTSRNISGDGHVLDAAGNVDGVFTGCAVNGQTCYHDAATAVSALHPENRIATTYAYSSLERYGAALLRCAFDRELLETSDRVYYRLLVPDADPRACPDAGTRVYRLVLAAAAPTDWLSTLFAEADAYGMVAYPGLPMPPTHPAPQAWRPDLTHLSMFNEFSTRILADYAGRHAGHDSLDGVYQSFETPLKQSIYSEILTLYNEQHALVRQRLPGRRIVVSPYWDARRGNANGTLPADIKGGFKAVARTGVDVIAPQDSRGTGKVGLFWPYEANESVDEKLAVPYTGIAAGTTNGAAYTGSTMDFYQAAWEARGELAGEGVNVELWANLEAFEPPVAGEHRCGSGGVTDKARMDRALMFARTYSSKIISFMWDHYYTCTPSLREEITAHFDQPVVAQGFRWHSSPTPGGAPDTDGLLVRGYHLAGATVYLTWYGSDWQIRSQDVVVEGAGWFDPLTGANSPDLPDLMQSVWVPFVWTDMAPSFWLHVSLTNALGQRATHRYSLSY